MDGSGEGASGGETSEFSWDFFSPSLFKAVLTAASNSECDGLGGFLRPPERDENGLANKGDCLEQNADLTGTAFAHEKEGHWMAVGKRKLRVASNR
jgi:hypothetical protein